MTAARYSSPGKNRNELEIEAELIQNSMAIEGYELPLEEVVEIVRKIFESDEPETIRRLIQKAKDEGRSDLEVFNEYYGPPSPPKDDT